MPMPKPRDNEERDDFISRCMGDGMMNDEYPENDQRAAICHGQWREAQKEKSVGVNGRLLRAVKARGRKLERFGRGILTADCYVANLLDVFGSDACYKFVARGNVSFADILTKAAETLVYSSDDMVVEEKARGRIEMPRGVELPKNTLMVFRHVLTTDRKDRDGDVMHSDGADLDPKMLLLWQHVPTMPIGKMIAEVEKSKSRVVVVSAIVDVNDLCHDAAVMVDNGMGRFSHGFRALEFAEIKAGREGKDEPGGFDVKKFEVMEESLVSVPANVDAETEEVLLSLVEGGKLTSPVLREQARWIKERRPAAVPVKLDLKVTVNGREVESNEDQPRVGGGAAGERREAGEAGAPEEAGQADAEAKAARDEEMKSIGYGELPGSWEFVTEKLRHKARRALLAAGVEVPEQCYVGIVATYPDYAVVSVDKMMMSTECTYYRIGWRMEGREPEFVGEPKRVDVQISAELREKARLAAAKAGSVKLHAAGLAQMKRMMGAGKTTESEGWEPPSAEAADGYIEEHGMAAFGKWHMGVRPGADPETKGAWAYPYTSDFKTVDRAGLVAIRQRAGQQKEQDIFEAAGEMMDMMDEMMGEEEEGKAAALTGEKQGRVLSKANETKIADARDDVDEARKMEGVTRPCKALLQRASGTLGDVLGSLGKEPAGEGNPAAAEKIPTDVVAAVDIVLNRATAEQRGRLTRTLVMMERREVKAKRHRVFRRGRRVRRGGPGGR